MDVCCFFFQAEDGIRDLVRSRGLGDVYKRQANLFARPLPKDHKKWGDKTIRDLVEYFDRTPQDLSLIHI